MDLRRRRRIVCTALILGMICGLARAHDTWIVESESDAPLGLTSGMTFPHPDFAVEVKRISRSGCSAAQGVCALRIAQLGAHELRFDIAPRARGSVVWIDLKPRTLTLSAAKVVDYFAEIEADNDVRAAWLRAPEPRHWIETYTKHAKSIVGPFAADDTTWRAASGQRLEIVAEANPTQIASGLVAFRVQFDGAPLPHASVAVVDGTSALRSFVRTDAAGRMQIAILHAGPWLLAVTRLRQIGAPKATWDSDFATLSFVAR